MNIVRFHKFFDAGEKICRARTHVGAVEQFIRHYAETSVHLHLEHDPATGENTMILAPAKFNAQFLCMIGDAIHNMSSALDSATSQIVAERSKRTNRRVYFPVHENLDQLKASFETKTAVPCKCGSGTVERDGGAGRLKLRHPKIRARARNDDPRRVQTIHAR